MGRTGGSWALGERARCRRTGRAGRAAEAAGAPQQLPGRAGNGRQARGQAWRGRAGARGWAHDARGTRPAWAWPAWAWPGRWMGAQAGPVLVHSAPGSVLARFLDPVRLGIFLSHQLNTVHCKIKIF